MNSSLFLTLRKGASQSILRGRIRSSSLEHKLAILLPKNMKDLSKHSFSSLPYHLVVGMPALSPTMEVGTIASWKVKEGESFGAGDSLAEIETDKATIDFEAQDDGVVAKLLVESGSGEINVGVPIMVTVEDEADVAAFGDFVVDSNEEGASSTSESSTSANSDVSDVAAPAECK